MKTKDDITSVIIISILFLVGVCFGYLIKPNKIIETTKYKDLQYNIGDEVYYFDISDGEIKKSKVCRIEIDKVTIGYKVEETQTYLGEEYIKCSYNEKEVFGSKEQAKQHIIENL